MKSPLIICGPSGAGKSHFCGQLKSKGWLYLEADQHPKDGIDELRLRPEWESFWKYKNPEPISTKLESLGAHFQGVVLSLPSGAIPPPDLMTASRKFMNIRFLWGDPRWCLQSFLARERASGRNLPAAHWDGNNRQAYSTLSSSDYHAYLIDVFDASGSRLPFETIENKL